MKICFLGAKDVGKTTFLAALSCMQQDPKGAYWNFPMEKPDGSKNEDIAGIRQAAEAIMEGEQLPATTAIRRGAAILHFPDQEENLHVEFIDLPGSDYSKGYDESDAQKISEIREHVNQCSCLYFFIEPNDLKKDHGRKRISTFLNVLRDYDYSGSKTRKKELNLLVCLALTKADDVDDDDEIKNGTASGKQIKEYFESHAGDNLEALAKQVGANNLFYAAFSTRRDGGLNLNVNEFTQLFKPLVADYNTDCRKKRSRIAIISLFAIGLTVASAYCFVTMILPDQRQHKDSERFEDVKNATLSYNNEKDLKDKVEKIRDPNMKEQAEEALAKKREENRKLHTEAVKRAKNEYHRNPSDVNKQAYYDAAKGYKEKVSPYLPEDLRINTQADELSAIADILGITFSKGDVAGYLSARSAAVEAYIGQFPNSCTAEIELAVKTARLMATKRKYTLKLSASGMDGDNSLAFLVQTKAIKSGERYAEGEEDEAEKKGFKKQAIFKENIEFDWDANTPLQLSVWNDNWKWTEFSGRITAPRKELFPIRHFCELSKVSLSYTPREKYKTLKISSSVYYDGKKLERSSIDLAKQYIHDSSYWEERKRIIQESIQLEQ